MYLEVVLFFRVMVSRPVEINKDELQTNALGYKSITLWAEGR